MVGEAEELWPRVLEDAARGRLRPLYLNEAEVDLGRSPVPRYELLAGTRCRVVWLQSGRGCLHDCSFCCASRVYGRRYRKTSVGQVLEAVHRIRSVHPHAMLGFADDSLLADRRRTLPPVADVRPCR